MSVDHLAGRRTGRPRSTRSTPAWKRAALWAFRHFADDTAEPPSEFARRLRDQARKNPGLLLHALAVLDSKTDSGPQGQHRQHLEASGEWADSPEPSGTRGTAARVLKLSVSVAAFGQYLLGYGEPPWAARLPQSFQVLGVDVDRRRRRVVLTIASPELLPVAAGQPIPVRELD